MELTLRNVTRITKDGECTFYTKGTITTLKKEQFWDNIYYLKSLPHEVVSIIISYRVWYPAPLYDALFDAIQKKILNEISDWGYLRSSDMVNFGFIHSLIEALLTWKQKNLHLWNCEHFHKPNTWDILPYNHRLQALQKTVTVLFRYRDHWDGESGWRLTINFKGNSPNFPYHLVQNYTLCVQRVPGLDESLKNLLHIPKQYFRYRFDRNVENLHFLSFSKFNTERIKPDSPLVLQLTT